VTRYEFSHLFAKAWYKAMTAPNIIASFKATGICPLDRSVVRVPGMEEEVYTSFKPESLVQRTGLAYIPLYSPSKTPHSSHANEAPACMTPLQPLQHNPTIQALPAGYNAQEESPLEYSSSESPSPFEQSVDNSLQGSVPLRRATSVSNFLIPPLPPSKMPTKHGKSSGTVLTSIENIHMINEKEREKKEKAQMKEERRLERERKAKLKRELKQKKAVKKIHNVAPIIGSVMMKEKGVTFKDAVDDVSSAAVPSQLPSSSELSDDQDLPPHRLATRRKGGGMYSILPQRGVTCNYPFMSECMLEVPTTCLSMLGHHCLLCIYQSINQSMCELV